MNKKRVNTTFAADVFITNCGGSILWLETEDGITTKIQEETTDFVNGGSRFGRVYQKEIEWDDNGQPYITWKGRQLYMDEFYDRHHCLVYYGHKDR